MKLFAFLRRESDDDVDDREECPALIFRVTMQTYSYSVHERQVLVKLLRRFVGGSYRYDDLIAEFDSKLVDCDVGIISEEQFSCAVSRFIDDNGRWKRPLFDHFIPVEDRSNMFQCPELHL
ncbi:hypothetical protein OIU85_029329 [Salix viminalis]|uniref:Uncharacterized protein n=1 Tax=Salix viminalis TaxID=40686 RepID=A0A9Q0QBK2_SALVM|nr:hypothetical protein OIU85_029329 [Salix viminalis]